MVAVFQLKKSPISILATKNAKLCQTMIKGEATVQNMPQINPSRHLTENKNANRYSITTADVGGFDRKHGMKGASMYGPKGNLLTWIKTIFFDNKKQYVLRTKQRDPYNCGNSEGLLYDTVLFQCNTKDELIQFLLTRSNHMSHDIRYITAPTGRKFNVLPNRFQKGGVGQGVIYAQDGIIEKLTFSEPNATNNGGFDSEVWAGQRADKCVVCDSPDTGGSSICDNCFDEQEDVRPLNADSLRGEE